MIQVLMNPVFYGSVFLALINRVLEELGIVIPVVHAYLDDLLCFPIVLSLGLIGYKLKDLNYRLTKWHIWSVVAIYAVYFECYLPTVNESATSDIWDIVMYSVGAIIFDRTINQQNRIGKVEVTAQQPY